jgi:hypothetical protein
MLSLLVAVLHCHVGTEVPLADRADRNMVRRRILYGPRMEKIKSHLRPACAAILVLISRSVGAKPLRVRHMPALLVLLAQGWPARPAAGPLGIPSGPPVPHLTHQTPPCIAPQIHVYHRTNIGVTHFQPPGIRQAVVSPAHGGPRMFHTRNSQSSLGLALDMPSWRPGALCPVSRHAQPEVAHSFHCLMNARFLVLLLRLPKYLEPR